jgi:hypothetical protein
MKKRLLISAILCLGVVEAFAQKPRNGKYTYAIAYWEWGSKPRNLTCEVVIKGDSVKVYSNDPAYKGQLIDEGVLLLHKKSGKWIIGHTPDARNAPRVGGCEEGPTVIEFKKKRVWLC